MLCPTVIIHGIDDEVVPIANSRRLAARSPSVLTILEANAGHQLNEDLSLVLEALTLLGLR